VRVHGLLLPRLLGWLLAPTGATPATSSTPVVRAGAQAGARWSMSPRFQIRTCPPIRTRRCCRGLLTAILKQAGVDGTVVGMLALI